MSSCTVPPEGGSATIPTGVHRPAVIGLTSNPTAHYTTYKTGTYDDGSVALPPPEIKDIKRDPNAIFSAKPETRSSSDVRTGHIKRSLLPGLLQSYGETHPKTNSSLSTPLVKNVPGARKPPSKHTDGIQSYKSYAAHEHKDDEDNDYDWH